MTMTAGAAQDRELTENASEHRPEAPRQALLVLGMHRSGTSATAGLLALLGAQAARTLEPANQYNVKGYWESQPLMAFHNRLLETAGSAWSDWRSLDAGWAASAAGQRLAMELQEIIAAEFGDAPVIVVKDPRICRFVPFWLRALEAAGLAVKVVIPLRNPLAVAQSLASRDSLPLEHALLLWLRHYLDAEAATRTLPRCVVHYEELLEDWRRVAGRIGHRLGLAFDLSRPHPADDFLSHDPQHQAGQDREVTADWTAEGYAALSALAEDDGGEPARAHAALDALRREMARAEALLGPLVGHWQALAFRRDQAERLAAAGAGGEVLERRIEALLGEFAQLRNAAAAQAGRAGMLTEHLAAALAALKEQTAELAALRNSLPSMSGDHGTALGNGAAQPPEPLPEPALASEPAGASGADPEAARVAPEAERTIQGAEHDAFDPAFYLARYPDVAESGMDPHEHYHRFGRPEGRVGAPGAER